MFAVKQRVANKISESKRSCKHVIHCETAASQDGAEAAEYSSPIRRPCLPLAQHLGCSTTYYKDKINHVKASLRKLCADQVTCGVSRALNKPCTGRTKSNRTRPDSPRIRDRAHKTSSVKMSVSIEAVCFHSEAHVVDRTDRRCADRLVSHAHAAQHQPQARGINFSSHCHTGLSN